MNGGGNDEIMLSSIVMKTFKDNLFVTETICQYFLLNVSGNIWR